MPYKIWSVNEILTAADMNDYVGNQTVLSFAGTAARATAIGTPVEGMVSYVGSGVVEVYAGTATGWTQISGGGGVTVGTAAPDSPSDGDLWWDSDDGELYLYYNDDTSSQWVAAAGPSVTVAATAPTGYEGQLWLDSTDGSMYTYYTDPGGANAQWIGAVSRSGGILQVVSTTKTDTFSASVAPGGLVSVSGFSASITPRSTSSKILVFVAIDGNASTADGHMAFRLMRGGSPVGVGDTAGSRTSLTASQTPAYASDNTALANAMKQFLDTPATTSTTTYSVEIHNSTSGSQTLYVNRSGADIDDAPRARTISTITLMEVAG
jgi:hypothetical protein